MNREQHEFLRNLSINAKVKHGIALNSQERSIYLLLIATEEQAKEYLRKEKAVKL